MKSNFIFRYGVSLQWSIQYLKLFSKDISSKGLFLLINTGNVSSDSYFPVVYSAIIQNNIAFNDTSECRQDLI